MRLKSLTPTDILSVNTKHKIFEWMNVTGMKAFKNLTINETIQYLVIINETCDSPISILLSVCNIISYFKMTLPFHFSILWDAFFMDDIPSSSIKKWFNIKPTEFNNYFPGYIYNSLQTNP